MSFFNSLIHSWGQPEQKVSSITKFLTHNNTPVGNFCSGIPIALPSLISTPFGKSIISLFILIVYLILYRAQTDRTGVESRLLISLILGNTFFAILTFNDWFNLNHQVILCNDYKNGILNLYQVSEALEQYRLYSLIQLYFQQLDKFLYLAYKQFTSIIFETTTEVIELIKNYKNNN